LTIRELKNIQVPAWSTADTALRLSKYFNMSARFWLGLLTDYDLDVAEDKLSDRLEKEI